MNVLRLSYAVWNGREEAEKFIKSIHSYIEKGLELENDIAYDIHFLSTTGEINIEDHCLVFGQTCIPLVNTTGKIWLLPTIKTLTSNHPRDKNKRGAGRAILQEVIDFGKRSAHVTEFHPVPVEEPKEETSSYIEYKGKTYGIIDTDIIMPKEEIDYLLKVKKLLEGGDVVFEKGDQKIRIKE